MKIAFTGTGSGGHFYPIIAIAEALRDIVREEHLLDPELYYLAPEPFDPQALYDNGIAYLRIPAGKLRRYLSLKNVTDLFVTLAGIVQAVLTLFRFYPDVVISKGGYGSVPVVLAAWILHIPIIVHESDTKPGRATLLAARFAVKIAISLDEAAAYFPEKVRDKIARTGTPVRKELLHANASGARQELKLDPAVPTVLILGGSQGAQRINETVLSALPELVSFANIIHQTGKAHLKDTLNVSKVELEGSEDALRYHPFDYLSPLALQRAASAADLVVSRAGTGSITEIAVWQKPAILIPIPESVSHDQRTNAYAYASRGAATVIEEENLSPHIFSAEIRRVLDDKEQQQKMHAAAAGFADPDAARILAHAVLDIAITHDRS